MRNRLGIAIAQRAYPAYRELLASARWRRLAAAGARPQRLLWASTGTKDPAASDTLYIEALAAPDTIDTMPEKTLLALAAHGQLRKTMTADAAAAAAPSGKGCWPSSRPVASTTRAWPEQLQREGAQAFAKSWRQLLAAIASKGEQLRNAAEAKVAP